MVAELSVLAEILIVLAWFYNIVVVSREMVKSEGYIVKFHTCKKRGRKKWYDLKTSYIFRKSYFHTQDVM